MRRIFTKNNPKSKLFFPENPLKVVFKLSSDLLLTFITMENEKSALKLKTKKILAKIKKFPSNCNLSLSKSEVYFLDGVGSRKEIWVVVLANLGSFELDNLYVYLLYIFFKNLSILFFNKQKSSDLNLHTKN